MSDQLLITLILVATLALFIWDKMRPDAVAMLALLACHAAGLLSVGEALDGFSSRAVITVAAVLVIGRTMEVTGAAAALTRYLVPDIPNVTLRLGALLLVATILSAFMNNIAALVITMPAAIALARDHRLPPGALLMSLAFATVLGGMTTLIGTPGNLILSSVREDALGAPYNLFDMAPVGGVVAIAGLVYLIVFGWRMTPKREGDERLDADPVRVFELAMPIGGMAKPITVAALRKQLRAAGAVLLTVFRQGQRVRLGPERILDAADRLLVMSRTSPWRVADRSGFTFEADRSHADDAMTARVTVAHGSSLIGKPYEAMEARSNGALRVLAGGPRPARLKQPLDTLTIQAGDQLFLHGSAAAFVPLAREARLLEVNREFMTPVSPRPALVALGVYGLAVAAAALAGVPVAIAFVAAALAVSLMRLIPSGDIYRSIDWQVIVLLAAMIPIGRAFHETGATQSVADGLSWMLSGASLPIAVGVLCAASMLLSSFLNNVATAVVMGQVGVETALAMGISVDAALLAVLIGSSCSFLTPIGHQNNLLVMRPGGYSFADYIRVGAPLSALVVTLTTFLLSRFYG